MGYSASKRAARGYSTPGGYPWSRFAVALLPSSIEHSGGVVTRWRDESGHGRHATPTGSPAYDDTGEAPAIELDGSVRLDGSIAGLDLPCTIFVLFTPANADAGGATWIVDMQSLAVTDGCQLAQYYTILIAFKGASFSQGAAFAYNSTAPVVIRGDFTTEGSALRLDGAWKAAAGLPAAALTAAGAGKYRIGKRLDNTAGAHGLIHAFLVLHGRYTDEELDRVEREILDLAGKAHPFAWPPQANALGGDPGLVLPAQIDAIAGRAPGLEFFKSALADRDGSSSLSFTSSLPLKAWAHDRWTVRPETPGVSETITISEGAYSATASINCVPMIEEDEDPIVVEFWGNSQVAHWRLGVQEMMANELGELVQFVGSCGPADGYSTKNTGYDSTEAVDFNTGSGAVIAGGVSPFWHNGALDMDWHFDHLDAPPTHFVGEIVQNTAYSNSMAALPAALTAAFVHVEAIFASALAANPSLYIGICTGCPFNLDPASGWIDHAGWLAFYEKALYARQRVFQQFGGRTAGRIWVIDTFTRVDTVRGFRDSIHWNMKPGGEQIREVLLPWLIAHRG